MKALAFVAALLAATPAFAADSATARQKTAQTVMQADLAFAALSLAKGAPAAFTAYLDQKDGRIFNGSTPLIGGAAMAPALAALNPNGTVLWWVPTASWGSASGDLAGTTGDWVLANRKTKKPIVTGRYADIWHKTTEGWKILVDMGTPDAKPVGNQAGDKIASVLK
jgi:ketosteroid isomerase-like protein